MINNGNGKTLYDTTLELAPVDFIKWTVQPIQTKDKHDKEIIVGAEILVTKYMPQKNKEKKTRFCNREFLQNLSLKAAILTLFCSIIFIPYIFYKKCLKGENYYVYGTITRTVTTHLKEGD